MAFLCLLVSCFQEDIAIKLVTQNWCPPPGRVLWQLNYLSASQQEGCSMQALPAMNGSEFILGPGSNMEPDLRH